MIDLPLMAVEVDHRPRRARDEHGEAARDQRAGEQIDPAILQPPQQARAHPRSGQQGIGIVAPGVGNRKDDGPVGQFRAEKVEGRFTQAGSGQRFVVQGGSFRRPPAKLVTRLDNIYTLSHISRLRATPLAACTPAYAPDGRMLRAMIRILLAEDDESMRVYLARALERSGYEVVAVSTGTQAVPYIDSDRFDLLLTDIVMPEMDGIELAQHAAQVAPEMRIMFITGFAAVTLKAGKAVPQAKVLSKPFHLRDLVLEVERMFGSESLTGLN